MALKTDTIFKGKLTFASKNYMRNLTNFHQSTFESLNIWTILGSFIQNRKCMSLKFTEELCVMEMKDDGKIEEKLTCQFKTDLKNLIIFDLST